MKTIQLFSCLVSLFLILSCEKKDAISILKKAKNSVQEVPQGIYQMEQKVKYTSGLDTVTSAYKTEFKKLKNDDIYPSAFHTTNYFEDKYVSEVIYTGDYFVTYSTIKMEGQVQSKEKWKDNIVAIRHNYPMYDPLTSLQGSPLPKDSLLTSKSYKYSLIGEENIFGVESYHIKIDIEPKNSPDNMVTTLAIENHFWINKEDFIPIKYTNSFDMVMGKDTMNQYVEKTLISYDFSKLIKKNLELTFIPKNINLKDYQSKKKVSTLELNSKAPNFSLKSLQNEVISLKQLDGKLVLLDFFYQSCFPCVLALPGLQELHTKYSNKGLRVIGIDPYDKNSEKLNKFLSKKGTTYPVLLDDDSISKKYQISSYPTIYLIDNKGSVIYKHVGYDENSEQNLKEIIKKYLE